MTEQETNVEGDCLNMSECGIYENGTSIGPQRDRILLQIVTSTALMKEPSYEKERIANLCRRLGT
jgi:hypothetical protein